MKELQVVIHAGGKGLRLRPHTEKINKTVIKVGKDKKPFLYYVSYPYRELVDTLYLTLHYKGDEVLEIAKRYLDFENIVGLKEPSENYLGRAGIMSYALKNGMLRTTSTISHNGSDLLIYNARKFLDESVRNENNGYLATVLVFKPDASWKPKVIDNKVQFDFILVDKNNVIKNIVKKPKLDEYYKMLEEENIFVNVGCIYLSADAMKLIKEIDPKEYIKRPLQIENAENNKIKEIFLTGGAKVYTENFLWYPLKEEKDLKVLENMDIEARIKNYNQTY